MHRNLSIRRKSFLFLGSMILSFILGYLYASCITYALPHDTLRSELEKISIAIELFIREYNRTPVQVSDLFILDLSDVSNIIKNERYKLDMRIQNNTIDLSISEVDQDGIKTCVSKELLTHAD